MSVLSHWTMTKQRFWHDGLWRPVLAVSSRNAAICFNVRSVERHTFLRMMQPANVNSVDALHILCCKIIMTNGRFCIDIKILSAFLALSALRGVDQDNGIVKSRGQYPMQQIIRAGNDDWLIITDWILRYRLLWLRAEIIVLLMIRDPRFTPYY